MLCKSWGQVFLQQGIAILSLLARCHQNPQPSSNAQNVGGPVLIPYAELAECFRIVGMFR